MGWPTVIRGAGAAAKAAWGLAKKYGPKAWQKTKDVASKVKERISKVFKKEPPAPCKSCGQPSPKINKQKQDGHKKGTPQHKNREKVGKPTSTWDDASKADDLTQEAWQKGTPVPGRPNVRDYDFGTKIGTGPQGQAQSKVRVHMDSGGKIHGHPK